MTSVTNKAQTKKQAIAKVKAMMKDHNKATIKKCEQLLNSGGVDVSEFTDNYLLPKILMHVALLSEAHQYKPLTKYDLKTAKNLMNF